MPALPSLATGCCTEQRLNIVSSLLLVLARRFRLAASSALAALPAAAAAAGGVRIAPRLASAAAAAALSCCLVGVVSPAGLPLGVLLADTVPDLRVVLAEARTALLQLVLPGAGVLGRCTSPLRLNAAGPGTASWPDLQAATAAAHRTNLHCLAEKHEQQASVHR